MRNKFYTKFKNKNNILNILTSQSNLKLKHNKNGSSWTFFFFLEDASSWTSLYNL